MSSYANILNSFNSTYNVLYIEIMRSNGTIKLIVVGSLLLLALYAVSELSYTIFRYHKGETLWSVLTKYGSSRINRYSEYDVYTPEKPEASTLTAIAPATATANTTATEPVALIEPITLPALVEYVPVSDNLKSLQAKEDSNTNIVNEMYLVKAGFIRMLWEQKAIEKESGNTQGLEALNILMADTEKTEPQIIWMYGSKVSSYQPTKETNLIMKRGYVSVVSSHLNSTKRSRNLSATITLERLLNRLMLIGPEALTDKGKQLAP